MAYIYPIGDQKGMVHDLWGEGNTFLAVSEEKREKSVTRF
jgi:hypothetical protein